MRKWLEGVLESGRHLPEEAEGYLLGRGMLSSTITRMGICLWRKPNEPTTDLSFREKYGKHGYGSYLEGRIVIPAWSPRGDLIGFEARTWDTAKKITDFRLREANWNPFFLGLTPDAMRRVWDGGDVWLVEGLFDLTAMERVVPETDVVLATVRAKVSDRHVEFLRRCLRPTAQVHVVYDNDETGRKQTHGWNDPKTGKRRWGALERLQRVSVSCRHIPYRGGKDPGVIWDTGGQEGLKRAFAHII